MNAISVTTSVMTHSLAWALIHSLWQGLIIYSVLYLLLKRFRDINARIKYYLSFTALTALAVWFTDTWITEYQKLKGFIVYISGTSTEPAVTNTYAVRTIATNLPHNVAASSILPSLERYFPVMMIVYSIGLAFMLSRFLISLLQVRRLKTIGLIPLAPQYYDLLADCKNNLGITRTIELHLSNRITVPMMLGAIKPVILLPLATINHLTMEQMGAILLHELAHIKRHDYLLNIFQNIAETILFFNPFVWLISAVVRREREHCCDDLVLADTNKPLPYAKALAILEGSRQNNRLALGATGSNNHLLNRIKRIMEMKKQNINHSQLAIIIAIIITIAFSIAMFTFTPSFAQKAKKQTKEKADTATKSFNKYTILTLDSNGKTTVIKETSGKPKKGEKMKTAGVRVTITDDSESDGTKVSTKIIVDKSGKQKIIRTRTTAAGHEEEIENEVGKDLFIDIRKMAEDIEQMAKSMNEAGIDINAVDWNELKTNLSEKLSKLDYDAVKKLEPDVRWEIYASNEAIKAAEIEIEKAGKHHVIAEEQVKKQAQAEKAQAKQAMEQRKKSTEVALEAKKITAMYEPMLQQMEQEGLINRSGDYKIVKDDDVLYINEQKQPANVYDKYKQYMKGKVIVMKESNIDKIININ